MVGNAVSQSSPPRWRSAVLGAVFAACGAAVLVALFVIVYGESAALRRYAIELGLAGTTLISAVAQVTIFVGLWLLWRSRRRRSGEE